MKKKYKFNNITSAKFNAYLNSILKFSNIEHFWEIPKIWKNKKNKKSIWKKDKFNNISSAMFDAYLISTLKFQFEKMIKLII